jgi:hypothetical protein
MAADAYRRTCNTVPIKVLIVIYEMDFDCETLFHNHLLMKEGICDVVLRFPEQSIEEDVHRILIYKEISNSW